MALSLVTAPASEPVTLAELKLHLRVDQSDEDELIRNLGVAAREYVETFTHRALLTQTWDDKRSGFPCAYEPIWIDKPPLQTSPTPPVISYVDQNGDTQTWNSTLYTVDAPAGPEARKGCVVPAYAQYYPLTRDVINSVTVRFVCGYGTTAASVPASLKAAIKVLVATWFDEARSAVNVGSVVTQVPMAIDALLWPYKAF